MRYDVYSTADFLTDDAFRHWVLTPDPASEAFWTTFLADHPAQRSTVLQARRVIETLRDQPQPLPTAGQVERMWTGIEDRLQTPSATPVISFRPARWPWAAAVTLLVVGLLGLYWWNRPVSLQTNAVDAYQRRVASAELPLLERINSGKKPLLVNLPDGSSVTLRPGGRLSFPARFDPARREVYLKGEAFFEVTKNPRQPFFVYANELTARVLGTSFNVRAYETDPEVVVTVKTGRVSVFLNQDVARSTQQASREREGIVLTPNQRVVFSRGEIRMKTSLVEQPALLAETIDRQSFEFNDTPAPQVFAALANAYGIPIVCDEELLRNCTLTASLTDEPLFEKLTLICEGIDARYEVVDGQVVITSRGCE